MVTPVDVYAAEALCEFLDSKFAPLLARDSPFTLLEVGCGAGALARIVKDRYKDKIIYKALDPSKEAAAKAKERGVDVQCVDFNGYQAEDQSLDVILFTKSFHHVPNITEAAERAHKLLKVGGLFIADEFAREAPDAPTATFFYSNMDALEAAGKLSIPARFNDDKTQDPLHRWHSKFAAHSHQQPKEGDNKHENHAHHDHDHGHGHQHSHAHDHAGHSHDHAGHGHGHDHDHAGHDNKQEGGHHHPINLPASSEMKEVLSKVFPNLSATPISFLYLFATVRYDGSQTSVGLDDVKDFRRKEEELLAKKEIVPVGVRFFASKM